MSGRRSRRSAAAGLKPFWFVGGAVLLVAIVAGYLIASWPGFAPKRVRVFGNSIVPASEILSRARVNPRENIWLQSAGAMARRIETIPYILRARVARIPPAEIVITVTERKPAAVVRGPGGSALVDASLRVLAPGSVSGLPVIALNAPVALRPGTFLTGRARAMRGALISLRAHDISVREIADDGGDVSAVLSGGVRVLLGDEANLHASIPLVEPILARFALLGRPVALVDLRAPQAPVVTERSHPPAHSMHRFRSLSTPPHKLSSRSRTPPR
ncbi:MAG: cell division protein FtsQ/DivIB [Candidatus Tyrphobacter sp.]